MYAEKRVRNSTSKSGPRDMKDPGKSCVAVSRQRDKLEPWQVRGCSGNRWVLPALTEPSEQLARLDLVLFISLLGTRQSKKDVRMERGTQPARVGVGWKWGRGPAHITSTKNSLGFPMAMRKDCLLAVSSGGTEARSRPGGAPGGPIAAGGGGIISMGGP